MTLASFKQHYTQGASNTMEIRKWLNMQCTTSMQQYPHKRDIPEGWICTYRASAALSMAGRE